MNLPVFLRFQSYCILAALLFLPTISNAQNENALLYHGNAFYWADDKTDTTIVYDNETGESIMEIRKLESVYYRMNEETIYNSQNYKETTQPVFEYNYQNEEKYLQTLLKGKDEFKVIPSFSIQKMVINQYGKPVYFELIFDDVNNAKALKLKWESIIEKLIVNMPRWQPGKYKSKPVLFYINPEIHIAN